jgi:hypothetical protein
MGQFMLGPDTAPGANPSQNSNYYGATDPAGALTAQPVGHPAWGAFPVAGPSTSTPQMHNQSYPFHQNQRISLTAGNEMQSIDSRSVCPFTRVKGDN